MISPPALIAGGRKAERVLGWNGYCDASDDEGRCTFGSVMLGDMESIMRDDKPFTGLNLSRFDASASTYDNTHNNFTALINVNDVDAVYARVTGSGVVPEAPPENQSWAKTFSMRDCNGFSLLFFEDIEGFTVEDIQRLYLALTL